MTDWTDLEPAIRLGSFAGIFLLLTGLEFLIPRKARVKPRLSRWVSNFSLLIVSSLLLRFALPITAVAFATLMSQQNIGLFNLTSLPVWLEVALGVIFLDLAIWAQHLLMHYVPPLWRFHRVHHADEDLDASSGIRFHPGEMLISFGFKLAAIAVLGPAALAVFLFEVLLNAASLFEHANLSLPTRVDTVLRRLIVTPDMHRVHHSVHPVETNSNFGFCLSIWDRIFRTYRAQPMDGHDTMHLGLDRRPAGETDGLVYVMGMPFRKT